MLKMIIADDEPEVRYGMTKHIDWKSHGIEIVACCANGSETYNSIILFRPDLVLLDINMPEMSGIEVIEKIRKEDIPVSFIILSGYDDFSYAQQAIRLNVDEYLLKPCSISEILMAVRKSLEKRDVIKNITGDLTESNFFTHYYEKMRTFDKTLSSLCYPAEEERAILNALRFGQDQELLYAVDSFLAAAKEKNHCLEMVMSCAIMLYTEIYRLIFERGIECHFDIFLDQEWDPTNVESSLAQALKHTVTEVMSKLDNGKSANAIINSACKYIEENYESDLSLTSVAKQVYITPTYLSVLFRQHLGVNFVHYVQSVRCDHAKQLLATTDLSNQYIAAKTGFSTDKYFSKVFKDLTGCTPSDYRSKAKQIT